MLDGADEPRRLLLAGQTEAGMDRGHDDVEDSQELVAEVDRAVGQDVGLGAVEDPKAGEAPGERPDLLPLRENTFFVEASGVGSRLAVIGDRDIGVAGVPRGHDHVFERVAAVGGGRVDVDQAAQVRLLEEPGERSGSAASISPLPSRSSGSM